MTGEVTPRNLFMAVLIFATFIGGGLWLISAYSSEYPDFINNQNVKDLQVLNSSSLNGLNEVQNDLNSSLSRLEEATSEDTNAIFASFGLAGVLLQGAWAGIKGIGTSFGFMGGLFTDIAKIIPLPGWAIGGVTLMITMLVILMIFTIVFNRKT